MNVQDARVALETVETMLQHDHSLLARILNESLVKNKEERARVFASLEASKKLTQEFRFGTSKDTTETIYTHDVEARSEASATFFELRETDAAIARLEKTLEEAKKAVADAAAVHESAENM